MRQPIQPDKPPYPPERDSTALASRNETEIANVEVQGSAYRLVKALGDIDTDDMVREMQTAGGMTLWLAYASAKATAEHKRAKHRTSVQKAEVGKEIRRRRSSLGEKITEAHVLEELTLDPRVQQAELSEIDEEEKANLMRGAHEVAREKHKSVTALAGLVLREKGATIAYDRMNEGELLRERMRPHAEEIRAGRRA